MVLREILLVLNFLSATQSVYLFLESNWQTAKECNGPPTTITLFTVSNPYNPKQPKGESWPIYFDYQVPSYAVTKYEFTNRESSNNTSFCGNLMVNLNPNEACCVSTIDWEYNEPGVSRNGSYDPATDFSPSPLTTYDSSKVNLNQNLHSVTSGTAVFISSKLSIRSLDPSQSGLKEFIPNSASGSIYCGFGGVPDAQTGTLPNLKSLKGFIQTFYLANSDCIEHYLSCRPDGTVLIYKEFGCKGGADIISLSNSPAIFSNKFLGNVTGSMITMKDTTVGVGWTTYRPSTKLVPNYHNMFEILETTLFCIAIAIGLLICGILYLRYRRTRAQELLFLLGTQISVVAFIIVRMAYLYAIFDNFYMMIIIGYVQVFMYSLSTFLTTLYTTHFIVIVLQPTERISKLLYSGITIIHFITGGSSYFYIFEYLQDYIGFGWFVYDWSYLFPLWLCIYFMTNTLPLSLILWKKSGLYSNVRNIWTKIKFINEMDEYYFGLILGSFVVVATYLITTLVQSTTKWLGSDRSFLAVSSIKVICVTVQSCITCFLNERVRVIMTKYSGSPLLPGPFDDGVYTANSQVDNEYDEEEEEEELPKISKQSNHKTVFENPFDDLEENGIRLE